MPYDRKKRKPREAFASRKAPYKNIGMLPRSRIFRHISIIWTVAVGDTELVDESLIGRASRPRELQDSLNYYIYHPLAYRLANLLAHSCITPNMVSIAGGLVVVAAAGAYSQASQPWLALLGFLLHMSWHVIDGADGDLARMTGRASPLGELVDGICDYFSHIVLYLVLAYRLSSQLGSTIAWTLTIAAGASHIIQSNHFEVRRRQYQWWVYGVPWLGNAHKAELAHTGKLMALGSIYLKLAAWLSPNTSGIDAAITSAKDDPIRRQKIRLEIKAELFSFVPRLNILNSTWRTIALGISMMAGSPIYYFVHEIVILNLALIWSIRIQRAATHRVICQIDGIGLGWRGTG